MLRPCPCCHSFETESLRSAYERRAYRTQIEKEKVAPPKKRRVVVLMALMVVTASAVAARAALAVMAAPDGPERLGAGSSVTGGLVFLVVIAWGLMRASRYNRDVWPAAMREWETKQRCRACRYIFAPSEPWPWAIEMEEPRSFVLPRA